MPDVSQPSEKYILIVDDEPDARILVRLTIENFLSTNTIEAANGLEALRSIEQSRPALVILDLSMPHMDGITFLAQLRLKEELQGLPIIIFTAFQLTPDQIENINIPRERIIQKGHFRPEIMIQLITDIITEPLKLPEEHRK